MKTYRYTRTRLLLEIRGIDRLSSKQAEQLETLEKLLLAKKTKKKCKHGVPYLKDSNTGEIANWTTCTACHPLPFEKETLEGLKKITILVERV